MDHYKLNHTGTIKIETNRMILRKFNFEDANDMLKNWISNPIIQNNYGEPTYNTLDDVNILLKNWISNYDDNKFYRWAIILKDTKENIGQIAFCRVYTDISVAEIEYCIGEKFWGNGYATEALEAIIKFAFMYPKFRKLEAFHRDENYRSGRVLEKSMMNKVSSITRFKLEDKDPIGETCYDIENE